MSQSWPSAKRAAAELVRLYLPAVAGPQKELRIRICAARDRAQAKACWAQSAESAQVYHSAAQIADAWWRRRLVEEDDLTEIIKILTWLFLAAGALERLEVPDE